MTLTSTRIQAGFEPIAGYVLCEKLGAGGYGEVWLAEAPGGLKKAIKFVHGNIDEDRANNEMKSLQRIRQVNHPFILSLERIEVIDGQLIIVTELAQGTLHDRYVDFREKGFAGISRERLLAYLRDAADGLDFLCQQHDLQHLDVKPANLLLVADRIKVADFGLIKDLQSNSLSMMAGLTPTYAAPEMFDGRPGRFSDQYSLAIVYQEMLTGTLPFRGRTTAQLANEHLQKAPNLESVPPLERPILSKALSKKPQLRFSDCREFIKAIENSREHALEMGKNASVSSTKVKPRPAKSTFHKEPTTAPEQPTQSVPVSGDNIASRSSEYVPTGMTEHVSPDYSSTNQSSASQSAIRSVKILPPMNLGGRDGNNQGENTPANPSVNPPKAANKTLSIGIGGVGIHALIEMRKLCQKTLPNLDDLNQRGFLIIDTDEESIQRAVDLDREGRLPYHCTVHVPLKSPQHYRQSEKVDFSQISRRWVYNIPRSLKTEGVRPLGMLAFLDRAIFVFESIREAVAEVARSLGEESSQQPIEVQIVSSAHGGTGSAVISEIGFFVRQIACEFGVPVHIELVLTCAIPNSNVAGDLPIATALACLTEINHYFKTEGLHPADERIPASNAVHKSPFNHVSLIYGGQYGSSNDLNSTIEQAGRFLWSLTDTKLGEIILSTRKAEQARLSSIPDHDITPWMSTVSTRKTEICSEVSPETSASRICLQIAIPWLAALDSIVSRKSQEQSTSPTDARTLEQIDFFIGDMFRTNRWTAQAWVHQCMQSIVDQEPIADQKPIANQSELETANLAGNLESHIAGIDQENPLNTIQMSELDCISDSLAIDAKETYRSVSRLVSKTRTALMTSIVGKFLSSPVAWTTIREVTRRTVAQFQIHSASLQIVAERLSEKHDLALDQIYKGEQDSTIELDQQLQAMAVEARFHSIAAKMLDRLAVHVTHLEDYWLHECATFRIDLQKWVERLCVEIGIRWNDSPETQSTLISVCRMKSDENVARDVKKRMLDYACKQLLPESTCEANLGGLFQYAVSRFCSKPQNAENPAFNNLSEKTDITNAIERNPATDPAVALPIESQNSSTKRERSTIEPTSLANELLQTRPYFVEFGGAIRNILLAAQNVVEQLQPEQRTELVQHEVTLIQTDLAESEIVCIGEQLVLSEIIDRVWMPSSQNWELTNRLYARVDVDWQPIEF